MCKEKSPQSGFFNLDKFSSLTISKQAQNIDGFHYEDESIQGREGFLTLMNYGKKLVCCSHLFWL